MPRSAYASPCRVGNAVVAFVERQPKSALESVRFGPFSLWQFSGHFRGGDAGEQFKQAVMDAKVSTPVELEQLMIRFVKPKPSSGRRQPARKISRTRRTKTRSAPRRKIRMGGGEIKWHHLDPVYYTQDNPAINNALLRLLAAYTALGIL